MFEGKFCRWMKWADRNRLESGHFPGIYIIAHSASNLAGMSFEWPEDIIYVGMTNRAGGLKKRLGEFDKVLRHGKGKHGGARRVVFKHPDYHLLLPDLYVSVTAVECDVRSKTPENLRLMGEVLRFEYLCFAEYTERYGRLPDFNDINRSPKN